MADKRIIDYNEAESLSSDDYLIIDGSTNGTRKIKPNQLQVTTDKTLSVENSPADAKAVGDELNGVKADLSEIEPSVNNIKKDIYGWNDITPTISTGQYLGFVGETISVSEDTAWRKASASAVVGREYKIKFRSIGYASALPYIFLCDENDIILSRVVLKNTTATVNETTITPSQDTAKIYVRSYYNNSTEKIKIEESINIVEKNQQDLSSLDENINDLSLVVEKNVREINTIQGVIPKEYKTLTSEDMQEHTSSRWAADGTIKSQNYATAVSFDVNPNQSVLLSGNTNSDATFAIRWLLSDNSVISETVYDENQPLVNKEFVAPDTAIKALVTFNFVAQYAYTVKLFECQDVAGKNNTENAIAFIQDHIDSINDKIGLTKKTITPLYIGSWLQKADGRYGYLDDTNPKTLYRVTTANTVALPNRNKRIIHGSIGDQYSLEARFGSDPSDMKTSLSWYTGSFEIEVPDDVVYYRFSLKHTNDSKIVPTENFELELYVDWDYSAIASNDTAVKMIAAARYFFSENSRNDFDHYAILTHVSDVHGDYCRLNNMYEVSDAVGADLACITGDIVTYRPYNNMEWFHEAVKSAKTKTALCVGNHDVYQADLDDEEAYDFIFAPIANEVGNDTGKTWYYTDVASKKLRMISINLYQYGGTARTRTHLNNDQISWFVQTLLSTPENYGVVVLMHSPQNVLAKDVTYYTFFQSARRGDNPFNDITGGVPVYDIIDAFISHGTLTKTYTQTGEPSEITVNADFSGVNSGVEFIAYLSGHFHTDGITYVNNTSNLQLMLNITCCIGLYGGAGYPGLAECGDIGRNVNDSSQDAINLYVIDRENKKVKVVRVGGNVTYQMQKRDYMEIPYANTGA